MTDLQDAVHEGLTVLRQLIQIDTTAGAGLESKAALWLCRRATERGWQAKVVEPQAGYGSLLTTFKGRSEDALLLLSHLDTAPVGSVGDWSRDPLSGEIADGYVWGRGAVDCKGLVAVWWAVLLLLERTPLERSVVWAAAAGEETRSPWGARWLREHCPELRRCSGVLNEGGGWPLRLGRTPFAVCQVGEKGYARLLLPEGRAYACGQVRIHARLPEAHRTLLRSAGGVAGAWAARLEGAAAVWFTQWMQRNSPHALDPHEMFCHCFEVRRSVEYPGRHELICRALPGELMERVLDHGLRRWGLRLNEGCDLLELDEPTASPLDDPLYEAIHAAHDLPVLPYIASGRSDSSWFRNAGIPVYGWFPHIDADDLMRMHRPDERISVAGFTRAVERLYTLVSRFAADPAEAATKRIPLRLR
ncbi:Succinyl-diaminopimelate desuccinylase [Paenibacillus solanacearum]|uniref:Succinyl-diaminopimelate desuccinylase n=1 Tax=Paenibacillus solanacearum TaxID=2048548 RepID=A0A916JUQ4_9BACL|nr:M20/M25/M40 family metallo-hydrolase [Paenibacillus solanacearum]CAG7604209.1 Succinyl-diaminopimelate desuccinylase [Paenibacillus solanacearum]